jgi:hypothetical protein
MSLIHAIIIGYSHIGFPTRVIYYYNYYYTIVSKVEMYDGLSSLKELKDGSRLDLLLSANFMELYTKYFL